MKFKKKVLFFCNFTAADFAIAWITATTVLMIHLQIFMSPILCFKQQLHNPKNITRSQLSSIKVSLSQAIDKLDSR